MLTTQIHMFIHDLPKNPPVKDDGNPRGNPRGSATTPKKSGKPSRPAKGPEIGVVVARVLSEETFGVQVSLTNPGQEVRGGWREGADKFDRDIAVTLALGKMMAGEPLPAIIRHEPTTKRAKFIKAQVDAFVLQATAVFKDKEQLLYPVKP